MASGIEISAVADDRNLGRLENGLMKAAIAVSLVPLAVFVVIVSIAFAKFASDGVNILTVGIGILLLFAVWAAVGLLIFGFKGIGLSRLSIFAECGLFCGAFVFAYFFGISALVVLGPMFLVGAWILYRRRGLWVTMPYLLLAVVVPILTRLFGITGGSSLL